MNVQPREKKIKEQQLLFSDDNLMPESLPERGTLQPAYNLSAVFDECHNYIYANEGLLKDKIFHEMVKLIVMKLYDEQETGRTVRFGITSQEYKDILAERPNAFTLRLAELYRQVKQQHEDLLSDDAIRLRIQTVAYLVGRLQEISLSKTPGDVKGEAFQSFTYRHQRGGRGEYFTPHPIVRLAVDLISPAPHEKVADPACGSGGFLIQAISHVQSRFPDIDKGKYIQECVRGTEFNPDVALSASIRLAFEGGTGNEVHCANALLDEPEANGTFDVILANPPFGSKGKVEDRQILKHYLLARKWSACGKSEWEPTKALLPGQSPDILFMEKCLKMLRPGGRMAIVLPDGLLQNVSNAHVRYWVRTQATVLGVVSIPQEAFIPYGTGIKTSLLLLQKKPADAPEVCFMARMQKIGYDVKGQPIYKRDNSGRLVTTSPHGYAVDDDVEEIASEFQGYATGEYGSASRLCFSVSAPLLRSRLDVEHYLPADREMMQRMVAEGAKPLGIVARIVNESDSFRLEENSRIRYIAISDVDARTMQVVSQQVIRSHEAPSRATYRLRAGDIITAVSGASTGTPRQATALIGEDEDGAICSNGFAVVRDVHGVDPHFLLAYMRTEYFLRQVRRLMTGHAIPSLSQEDLSRILVPIPSESEQKKIAQAVITLQAMRREAIKAGEQVIAEANALVRGPRDG